MFRVLLTALALSSAGCSMLHSDVDAEDQAFFYRGWVNPHRDLDQPDKPVHFGGGAQPPPSSWRDPLID